MWKTLENNAQKLCLNYMRADIVSRFVFVVVFFSYSGGSSNNIKV